MRKKALLILKEKSKEFKQAKYAGVPLSFIPHSQYSDRTSNGLTKCVIDWISFNGHQVERVSNQGRVINTRRKIVDVVGFTREIGSITRIKSAGTNGTSDLHCVVNGIAVKIEVKVGRDIQSVAQRRYQQQVEAAGGVYVVATDFESFYAWYIDFVGVAIEKEKGGTT